MLSRQWQKSSFSNGNGGNNCVEARLARGDAAVGKSQTAVEVRDSKDPSGPTLKFTAAEWKAFLGGTTEGEFNLPASVR